MKNTKFESTIREFTRLLVSYDIPFEYAPFRDGAQWKFSTYPDGDVAIHSGTYHSDEGYLESYGMPWDEDDVTVTTPYEMVLRLSGDEPREEMELSYTAADAFNSLMTSLSLEFGEDEDEDEDEDEEEEEDEYEDEEEDYRANDECFTLSDLLNFFNEAL